MNDLMQITAEYSNMVLVAILPYISEFAQKANLECAKPITTRHVAQFRCNPRRADSGGLVLLTNGFRFGYAQGRVVTFACPKSYFAAEDILDVQRFYGRVKISEQRATEIAQDLLKQVGSDFHSSLGWSAPLVTRPEGVGPGTVARYRLQWRNRTAPTPGTRALLPLIDMELDAEDGHLLMISLSPNVAQGYAGATERDSALGGAAPKVMEGGTKTVEASPEYARQFLDRVLPQMSAFVASLGLELEIPLSTNHVHRPEYFCGFLDGRPIAQVVLTNGDRFNYQHGRVAAFYAHDAYHKFPHDGRPSEFLGTPRLTESEAIHICERTIRKLGFTGPLSAPLLGSPKTWQGAELVRRVYCWYYPESEANFASCEVDLVRGTVKGLYLDDPSLWRNFADVNTGDKEPGKGVVK